MVVVLLTALDLLIVIDSIAWPDDRLDERNGQICNATKIYGSKQTAHIMLCQSFTSPCNWFWCALCMHAYLQAYPIIRPHNVALTGEDAELVDIQSKHKCCV